MEYPDPQYRIESLRVNMASARTFGGMRDTEAEIFSKQLEDVDLSGFDLEGTGDVASNQEPAKRPSTPPTVKATNEGSGDVAAVTLGCIRDLFSNSWEKEDGGDDADAQELLAALSQESALAGENKKYDTFADWLSLDKRNTFNTISTGSRDIKPGIASLFDLPASDLPPPMEEDEKSPATPPQEHSSPIMIRGEIPHLDQPLSSPASSSPPSLLHPSANDFPKPPCGHNNWDNIRVKKGFFGLRCRSCLANWKAPIKLVAKCPAFFNGYCPNGVNCPLPHIHRYKNPEKEKVKAKAIMMQTHMRTESALEQSQRELCNKESIDSSSHSEPSNTAGEEDNQLCMGAAVHIAPEPGSELKCLQMGGVGTIVSPGFDSSTKKWHIDIRDQGTLWVHESSVRLVWKRGGTTHTAQEHLEATFAVPSSVVGPGSQTLAPDKAELLQKLITEKLADSAFTTAIATRPCNHNNWDNVRIVKGKVGLRCRSCGCHWKAEVTTITKCPAFFCGYCPNGVNCPLPHIHRYKNKAKEENKARMVALAIHGVAQATQNGAAFEESKFAVDPVVFNQNTSSGATAARNTSSDGKVPAAPCPHNSWRCQNDDILCCTICNKIWDASFSAVTRCPAYFNGHCHAATLCPMAHVERHKS